jgi:hypothetical protein
LVRNAGTMGGSLCHADPAGDWGSVMLALDAQLVARSSGGERSIPAAQFFQGPFTTALEPDELLVEIRLPRSAEASRAGRGRARARLPASSGRHRHPRRLPSRGPKGPGIANPRATGWSCPARAGGSCPAGRAGRAPPLLDAHLTVLSAGLARTSGARCCAEGRA